MKTPDRLNIEILPDGTIKIDTDGISMPNHASAEAFVKDAARLAGGETTKERKRGRVGHLHTHQDGTTHDHETGSH